LVALRNGQFRNSKVKTAHLTFHEHASFFAGGQILVFQRKLFAQLEKDFVGTPFERSGTLGLFASCPNIALFNT